MAMELYLVTNTALQCDQYSRARLEGFRNSDVMCVSPREAILEYMQVWKAFVNSDVTYGIVFAWKTWRLMRKVLDRFYACFDHPLGVSLPFVFSLSHVMLSQLKDKGSVVRHDDDLAGRCRLHLAVPSPFAGSYLSQRHCV
jgi:hypothetical protein